MRERLSEYRELGARFTKWRAVIAIAEGLPTPTCLETNAHALALFAALSQEAGLVPIVEPEVLMDGDHTLARCEEVTRTTLERVFGARAERSVEGRPPCRPCFVSHASQIPSFRHTDGTAPVP